MSPEYVRAYVKANKNDDRDDEAFAEAAMPPTMRFMPVKSESQSDIQALHRARSRLVAERKAQINHLRPLLLERGIIVPKHGSNWRRSAQLAVFADETTSDYRRVCACWSKTCVPNGATLMSGLPLSMRSSCQWRARTKRPVCLQQSLGSTYERHCSCPCAGEARSFGRGRDLAAGWALAPRQRQPEASRGCSAYPSAAINSLGRT